MNNTFDDDKAERRAKRQATIARQLEQMERSVENADQSYRNFVMNVDAEESVGSGASPTSSQRSLSSRGGGATSSRRSLREAAAAAAATAADALINPDVGGSFRLPKRLSAADNIRHKSSAAESDYTSDEEGYGSDHHLGSRRVDKKLDMARKFLNDEDDDEDMPALGGGGMFGGSHNRSTVHHRSGRLNDSDPEFLHADADGSGGGGGSPDSDQHGSASGPMSFLSRGRTMLRNAHLTKTLDGSGRGVPRRSNSKDSVHSIDFNENLHNLANENLNNSRDSLDAFDQFSASIDRSRGGSSSRQIRAPNFNKLMSSGQLVSSQQKSTVSLDDDDEATMFERIEWAFIDKWNRLTCAARSNVDSLPRPRRCLHIVAAATAVVALVAAVLATWGPPSVDGASLPSLPSIGGFGGDGSKVVGGDAAGDEDRLLEIRDRIMFADASAPSTLEGKEASPTPQYQALEWLAVADPMMLDPDDPHLLQRYALAVVWFAMTYEDGKPSEENQWVNHNNWLTGKGICIWHGVACSRRGGAGVGSTTYDDNSAVMSLNLTENGLRGELPKEIYNVLKDLTHIDLSQNDIVGTIATEIRHLSKLEVLNIGGNSITGSIPTVVGTLSKLKDFYAYDNLLTGQIPKEIGNLVNLYSIGLQENQLSGPVTPALGRCQKLRRLYLDTNQLTSTIPEEIYTLGRLADLQLSDNKLQGTISDDMDKLQDLQYFLVDRNELTGTVPRTLGMLGNRLEELHLQLNELTGSLPAELGRLGGLKQLFLSSNKLTGTIPTDWAGMKDLQQLFISDNYIKGSIPSEIVGMEYLRALQLQSNDLSGSIPTQLGTLFRMEYIHLEENKLTGALPEEVGQLIHLEKLTIHDNSMSGAVPDAVCTLVAVNNLDEFIADCSGDKAPMDCVCCSDCK